MCKKKILVFAPHPDDEILGLGGYLLSESEKGSEINIVFATTDGSAVRDAETREVLKRLGVPCSVLYPGMDGKLSQVDMAELVGKLDDEIYAFEPDELFVNYPSHHQDHKVLYDATIAACRLKQFFVPPAIMLYEYGFIGSGPIPPQCCGGKIYFPMSQMLLEKKIELFSLYKSQQKESPSPLNGNSIMVLSSIRGLEAGCEYAEAFYLHRMILEN